MVERILAGAAQVLATEGYAQMSTNRVAAAPVRWDRELLPSDGVQAIAAIIQAWQRRMAADS